VPYYVPNGATEVINYTVPLTSWSVGASYKAADNLNLFVRASKGTRFNSDRLTFGGNFNADGSLKAASSALAADTVYQYEIGLKNRGELGAAHYTVELTVYHSHFNVFTYELNPNVCMPLTGTATCPISDKYKTTGVEFYGTLHMGGFSLLANATYNKADKQPGATASAPNPVYSRSNGIPDLSYTLAANYDVLANASLGVDVTGVTSTLNSNGVEFGGSTVVGANVKFIPVPNLIVGVNVYNLFNTLALMGPDNANEIAGANGSFVGTASSVIGRTVTASVKFKF
jgi:outer membrane receptor protein involved in Fe transport